ncbi:hypothetical protein CXB51_019413 [Gossypium anomalum]|uniref:Retrotransposon gag domain-containing protein n=1 Tax=Gossypium anomalum TaxID=47600 RepID=A0A8J6CVH5_9ROSI|nr:hypothetical protein CXB51_019413 [Gossypium anomalum]
MGQSTKSTQPEPLYMCRSHDHVNLAELKHDSHGFLYFMTRRNPSGPLLFDEEIDRTTRRNQREIRRSLRYTEEEQEDDISTTTEKIVENQDNPLPPAIPIELANQNPAPRTMYDYAKPNFTGTESSIVRPAIAANNFELKPNTIQMIQQFVQFDGFRGENPNTHLANFLELCDTFKINGVSNDTIAFAKTAKLRNDISSFVQMDLETLYDAWERYKDLLRRCPHHGLPLWLQVQTFYNSVNPSTRQMIDGTAGGTINNKTPEEASKFIEEISLNNYQWQIIRTKPTKIAGVYNVDSDTMLSNQVELLNKKIDGLLGSTQVHLVMRCDSSGGGVLTEYPPFNPTIEEEQVNYMGNNNFRSQNNPYSNTYNTGWKNRPNFSWGGQGNQGPQNLQGFQQPPYQQEKKPNLEEMLSKFISLSKLIFERPQGRLPSNTEPNPRGQLNAISTQYKEGFVDAEPELMQETMIRKGKSEASHNKSVNEEYKPRVPYPNVTRKDHSDEQFGKFLKLLKKLHINLPFIEALSQMPNAMKFLREILANKRKLDEASHVELNAVCSAILQNKLPKKLKDLGSFTIPCLIGSLDVNNH